MAQFDYGKNFLEEKAEVLDSLKRKLETAPLNGKNVLENFVHLLKMIFTKESQETIIGFISNTEISEEYKKKLISLLEIYSTNILSQNALVQQSIQEELASHNNKEKDKTINIVFKPNAYNDSRLVSIYEEWDMGETEKSVKEWYEKERTSIGFSSVAESSQKEKKEPLVELIGLDENEGLIMRTSILERGGETSIKIIDKTNGEFLKPKSGNSMGDIEDMDSNNIEALKAIQSNLETNESNSEEYDLDSQLSEEEMLEARELISNEINSQLSEEETELDGIDVEAPIRDILPEEIDFDDIADQEIQNFEEEEEKLLKEKEEQLGKIKEEVYTTPKVKSSETVVEIREGYNNYASTQDYGSFVLYRDLVKK